MRFDTQQLAEINKLLDEGLRRLQQVEDDINMLLKHSQSSDPAARGISIALAAAGPDRQLATIKKARAALKLVRAKLEIDEFSDDDAHTICDVLDDVVDCGRQLAAASTQYHDALHQQAELN